jgi:hypothetical protein
LPPYLFTLGSAAFDGSAKLPALALPSTVTVIGDNAVRNCAALTSIALPAGLVGVGSEAFSGSGLASIALPQGVTALGYRVFAACASLEWVEFLYEDAPVPVNTDPPRYGYDPDPNTFPMDQAAFTTIYVPDLLVASYVGTENSPSSWGNATLRGMVVRQSAKP